MMDSLDKRDGAFQLVIELSYSQKRAESISPTFYSCMQIISIFNPNSTNQCFWLLVIRLLENYSPLTTFYTSV